MKLGLLRDLIAASYIDNLIDDETVLLIADRLTRSELKEYVKALAKEEKARTVLVDSAMNPSKVLRDRLQAAFRNKRIIYREDASLLLGVRIIDNDNVYGANLKDSLDTMASELLENYD